MAASDVDEALVWAKSFVRLNPPPGTLTSVTVERFGASTTAHGLGWWTVRARWAATAVCGAPAELAAEERRTA